MKNKLQKLLFAGLLSSSSYMAFGQAEIQIIHNSSDPSAASVDIYVDGALTLDDFSFRTATGFLSLPSEVLINIGVAPGTSESSDDIIANFEVTLEDGQRYIAVANGVLDPALFAANPNGTSTAFTLFIEDNIQNMAMNAGDVDFVVVHGSTDAPTVDVIARDVATLVDDASYSYITPYINVPANNYILDVALAAGEPVVASFQADISALGGGSAVIFASGFLDPSTNQDGEAFGLFAALANGTVVAFPPLSTARLQVIHNAADPAAEFVDIYLNGEILLDDFEFRTATPFIDALAGQVLNIGVAPGNSESFSDTLVSFNVTLEADNKYVAIANGVLNPSSFAVNPDGTSTAFTLFLQNEMIEEATSTNVDFRAVHGASDAPTVDVIARDVATLVNDASYSNITPYITVPPASYILDVTVAAGTPIVASFAADLSTLGGGTAVVFASGFLDPSTNQDGAAFGLFAALANGTVVAFPPVSLARLQVIHNAADPAAEFVDIYVNGGLEFDDFEFRTATPFLDLPASEILNIGVAPGSSSSVSDTLKNFAVTLVNGEKYIAVANGVLNPLDFAVNPDGTSTAFTLFLQNQMREEATLATNVDFRVIHGASDAPTVDVLAGGGPLVDNAAYSNITPYLSVPAAEYVLDVTLGNDNSAIVASYIAPLTGLAGGSAVILASGFLDPSTNQNGEAFGLLVALADGTTFLLDIVSGIDENSNIQNFVMSPNPANDVVRISPVGIPAVSSVEIINTVGQIVKVESLSNSTISIPVNDLESGIYFIRVQNENSKFVSKLIVE
jgi:Domain of unknown function (DUF4397)/Secretion system C-terminal sorting domain